MMYFPRTNVDVVARAVGLFSGVASHSPVEVLEEAVTVARELQPDVLVSVGR